MVKVLLEKFNVSKIIYTNNIKEQEKNLELQNTIRTNVKYNKEEKHCVCSQLLKIAPSDTTIDFFVEIEIVGLFSYEGDNKKEIHVEVSNVLYSYLKTTSASIMSTIGLAGFDLPVLNISPDDVKEDE